jgi:hypothetical protein
MNLTNCNGCDTPAATNPPHANNDGLAIDELWQFDPVVGMMMYLANSTCPDITHQPRQSHAIGVKRITRYLKQTKTEGMYLCPQESVCVNCYVDADFAGLFVVTDKQDPISVNQGPGMLS